MKNNYIYRYNHERMREKGLITGGTISKKYLYLQALYRANLDAYLSEILDLGELDAMIKDSKLGFVSSEQEGDLYEKESSMGFEFLYLRNNLYIENLTKEQLERLEEHLKKGDEAVTDELKAMAAETCRDVIRVRETGNWEDTVCFLYPAETGSKPEIPSQALVLAITNCAEYDKEGNFLPGDNMRQKCEYLNKVKEEKEKEYTQRLGICVYIHICK